MEQEIDLDEIEKRIKTMKMAADDLKQMSYNFPALNRNIARILASINMLKINISDIAGMNR